MSLTTATPATTTTEPAREGWAEVAAELHRIADALATLGPDMPEPHCGLTLSSRTDGGVDDAKRMAAVDAISLAVLGESGELDVVGTSVHEGKRRYGPRRSLIRPVYLSIFDTVTDPAHVSENARLRAELAEATRRLALAETVMAIEPAARRAAARLIDADAANARSPYLADGSPNPSVG